MEQDTHAQREPSEQEVREYVEQLRSSPVEQVLAEVCSAMLSAAQVKLGRADGRLLIDVVSAVTEQVRDHDVDDLVTQLDEALTQLRLAQVDAEKQVGQAEQQDTTAASDVTGGVQEAGSGTAPGAAGSTPPTGGQPSAQPDTGKRLWTPGS